MVSSYNKIMTLFAKDVMDRDIPFVDEDATIDKIAIFMSKEKTPYVIVKHKGYAVGIITDTDIIKKVVAKNLLPKKVRAKDIMSYPLIFVRPNDEVQVATSKMRIHNINRVVVIDEKKNLVGVITSERLAKTLPEFIDILELKNEIENEKKRIFSEGPEEESMFGICDECGNISDDLRYVDGKWLCESCRENLL